MKACSQNYLAARWPHATDTTKDEGIYLRIKKKPRRRNLEKESKKYTKEALPLNE